MLLTEARRDLYMPLDQVDVPKTAREKLAALGITTLEELRDIWTFGNRQLLTDYLGDSPVRFAAFRPATGPTRGLEAASGPGNLVNLSAAGPASAPVRHPLGLALTADQRDHPAQPPEPLSSRSRPRSDVKANLIDRFPAVRDQKQRGTCVAFTCAALMEFHLGRASRPRAHSEQFLYWGCKEDDGNPNGLGTTLAAGKGVLERRGVCLATTWPYEPLPIGPTEGQGPPPDGAEAEAGGFTTDGLAELSPNDIPSIRAVLDQGRPVALGVFVYPEWFLALTRRTGEIPLPLPHSYPDGGHAVCLVGYEENPAAPGGGSFLFRNSWGRSWAAPDGRFGPGYGTLFFAYVRMYGVEAFG